MVITRPNKRFVAIAAILLIFLIGLLPIAKTQAQTYRFTLPAYEVEAYLESDGSLTLYYYMLFQNDNSASPIDFIDLALPYADYDLRNIEATIDGQPMPEVNDSAYVHGAELALKDLAIQPGAQGTVIAWVRDIQGVLFPYDQPDRENYLNFQITPNYFGSEFDRSRNTEYRMTIILPPDVRPDDGVYYEPEKWPGETISEAALTQDGRVYYSWFTDNADVHSEYKFGTAFPASAVPAAAISVPGDYEEPGDFQEPSSGVGGFSGIWRSIINAMPCLFGIGFVVIGIFSTILAKKATSKRKLEYFPPKLAVEGKGIKRGLTAVEAGVLLEEPLDKVLTMILFGLLKKEAITVLDKDPLKIKANDPLPEGLYEYETDFIKAFSENSKAKQRKSLQSMLIQLVDQVKTKMKGFSMLETQAYYRDITRRAWLAVEGAQTPEIKSAQFDHTLEWTMLDDKFNDRTQQTFYAQPVFIPRWWHLYNPAFTAAPASGPGLSMPTAAPVSGSSSKPSVSMPNIPGSDFAASIINGATAVSSGVVGDLTGFTNSVTSRTNPIPVSRSSSGSSGFRGGGGGSSCACACACAGCACACAGGGR